ncbi:UDP-N-acetylmuramoyl-L-alanyl-D-glutamate--2,6-diaminopimelate ligase [Bacillus sp. 2205SS5-2]|uniref:UDP-N-acetylmuramoyl-L-alanyl-D-glutamate--2, 6-diaminopimelate ligase n=1 Tax=Bacillus sp. 2205SS5-2 TaxID=3109031 RepID=UPI0030061331
MKLHTLIKVLPLYSLHGAGNPLIHQLKDHHSDVKQGDLFFCIKGEKIDSHDFVNEAVESGAVAVVTEKPLLNNVPCLVVENTRKAMAILADHFYGQPSKKLSLIGITGTNGKTTTSHMIEKILRDASKKTGLVGTLYSRIGSEETTMSNTTPNSLYLQPFFSKLVQEQGTHAIMEVSSHALVQGRVHGCDFDVAVFTNLSQDHLDYHGTMEEYRYAKGLLFSQLGNSYSTSRPKYAILNIDDPEAGFFYQSTAAHVLTYGIRNNADFMAKNIDMNQYGTTFTLQTPSEERNVTVPIVGEFNVYNLLAAIAAGYIEKIPLGKMVESMKSFSGVKGRFQLIQEGQDFMVIVDYAHTPAGLKNVLETIKKFVKGKVWVVVGCGGDRDKLKRPQMALVACQFADHAIFTTDNPRTEDPLRIIKDMERGGIVGKYTSIVDRKQAITTAILQGEKSDVIIIAGKGHESYQLIGTDVLEFDDVSVSQEALKELVEYDRN